VSFRDCEDLIAESCAGLLGSASITVRETKTATGPASKTTGEYSAMVGMREADVTDAIKGAVRQEPVGDGRQLVEVISYDVRAELMTYDGSAFKPTDRFVVIDNDEEITRRVVAVETLLSGAVYRLVCRASRA